MTLFNVKNRRGYIAITTAFIFTLLTLFVSASIGSTGFLTRNNNLNSEYKRASFALASSCLDIARLRLRQNINYAGDTVQNVSGETCTIYPIESSPPDKIIKVKASSGGAVTNLKMTVNPQAAQISLEELPTM